MHRCRPGRWKPTDKVDVYPGTLQIGKYTIRDHHNFDLLYGETPAGQGDIAALAAISLIADYLVNDFLGTRQDSEWQRQGAQALDYLGLDGDELFENRTEIFDELQEAQAYRQ